MSGGSPSPAWFNTIRGVLLGITTTLIVAGNVLCLLVLRRSNYSIHNVTKLFMGTLAVSDLLTGLLVAAPMIVSVAMDRWPYGDVACDVYAIAKYICYISSPLSLTAVTVERYLMVIAPLRHHRLVTLNRARMTVASIWVTSVAIPVLFGAGSKWTGVIDEAEDNCSLGVTTADFWYYPLRYGEACVIFTPVVLVVTLYTHMWMKARHHVRKVATIPSLEQRRKCRVSRVGYKTAVTFFIITAAFAAAWTPSVIRKLHNLITGGWESEYLEFATRMAQLTNSWVNVIIYYLRNRSFKNAVRKCLGIAPARRRIRAVLGVLPRVDRRA